MSTRPYTTKDVSEAYVEDHVRAAYQQFLKTVPPGQKALSYDEFKQRFGNTIQQGLVKMSVAYDAGLTGAKVPAAAAAAAAAITTKQVNAPAVAALADVIVDNGTSDIQQSADNNIVLFMEGPGALSDSLKKWWAQGKQKRGQKKVAAQPLRDAKLLAQTFAKFVDDWGSIDPFKPAEYELKLWKRLGEMRTDLMAGAPDALKNTLDQFAVDLYAALESEHSATRQLKVAARTSTVFRHPELNVEKIGEAIASVLQHYWDVDANTTFPEFKILPVHLARELNATLLPTPFSWLLGLLANWAAWVNQTKTRGPTGPNPLPENPPVIQGGGGGGSPPPATPPRDDAANAKLRTGAADEPDLMRMVQEEVDQLYHGNVGAEEARRRGAALAARVSERLVVLPHAARVDTLTRVNSALHAAAFRVARLNNMPIDALQTLTQLEGNDTEYTGAAVSAERNEFVQMVNSHLCKLVQEMNSLAATQQIAGAPFVWLMAPTHVSPLTHTMWEQMSSVDRDLFLGDYLIASHPGDQIHSVSGTVYRLDNGNRALYLQGAGGEQSSNNGNDGNDGFVVGIPVGKPQRVSLSSKDDGTNTSAAAMILPITSELNTVAAPFMNGLKQVQVTLMETGKRLNKMSPTELDETEGQIHVAMAGLKVLFDDRDQDSGVKRHARNANKEIVKALDLVINAQKRRDPGAFKGPLRGGGGDTEPPTLRGTDPRTLRGTDPGTLRGTVPEADDTQLQVGKALRSMSDAELAATEAKIEVVTRALGSLARGPDQDAGVKRHATSANKEIRKALDLVINAKKRRDPGAFKGPVRGAETSFMTSAAEADGSDDDGGGGVDAEFDDDDDDAASYNPLYTPSKRGAAQGMLMETGKRLNKMSSTELGATEDKINEAKRALANLTQDSTQDSTVKRHALNANKEINKALDLVTNAKKRRESDPGAFKGPLRGAKPSTLRGAAPEADDTQLQVGKALRSMSNAELAATEANIHTAMQALGALITAPEQDAGVKRHASSANKEIRKALDLVIAAKGKQAGKSRGGGSDDDDHGVDAEVDDDDDYANPLYPAGKMGAGAAARVPPMPALVPLTATAAHVPPMPTLVPLTKLTAAEFAALKGFAQDRAPGDMIPPLPGLIRLPQQQQRSAATAAAATSVFTPPPGMVRFTGAVDAAKLTDDAYLDDDDDDNADVDAALGVDAGLGRKRSTLTKLGMLNSPVWKLFSEHTTVPLETTSDTSSALRPYGVFIPDTKPSECEALHKLVASLVTSGSFVNRLSEADVRARLVAVEANPADHVNVLQLFTDGAIVVDYENVDPNEWKNKQTVTMVALSNVRLEAHNRGDYWEVYSPWASGRSYSTRMQLTRSVRTKNGGIYFVGCFVGVNLNALAAALGTVTP